MNELNVFNNSWSPWKYPSNWIRNARMFFRQFKWAYQRITRGYCDVDWWDFDTYLTRLMADAIEHLADNTISYPGQGEWDTPEKWDKYLRTIVIKLRRSLNDEMPNEYEEAWLKTWENKELPEALNCKTSEEEEITKKYLDVENKNEEYKYQQLMEALDMIKHCISHLWD